VRFLFLAVALLLSSCASDPTILIPARYAELPGWASDQHAEPLKLFVDSCAVTQKKSAPYGATNVDTKLWRDRCAKATALAAENTVSNAQAKAFFETYFTPHRVTTRTYPKGRITGYYEPLLQGSRARNATYQTPVYALPQQTEDRQRSRAEIEAGALDGKVPVLLYVDDPVMLFFLHIQGSGKVRLPDGEIVGLQYAGKNDQAYVAIGKILKERGELETVTMQTIRDWLRANPDAAAEVMNQNPSYIYFTLTDGTAYAKGAQGLSLTPLRSIAVDDERASYGVPTYIAVERNCPAEVPPPLGGRLGGGQPMALSEQISAPPRPSPYGGGGASDTACDKIQRLFVSQDTGGALLGPHRADIFFGQGDAAEQQAGEQNALAEVYWLLPTQPTK
jgi:membrane-bound lytic murein transglycosylase A